jgi:hypothetical protein
MRYPDEISGWRGMKTVAGAAAARRCIYVYNIGVRGIEALGGVLDNEHRKDGKSFFET